MKLFLISMVFIFSASSVFAENIDIIEVRKLYVEAFTDKNKCKEMNTLLSKVDEKAPLLLGYRASVTMMMANFAFNPFSKLSLFKKGRQMLEQAIALDKKDVELRTLRYLAQINTPSFLGYNLNIDSDREFILNQTPKIKDAKSKEFVIGILKQAKQLSADEEKKLN